MCQTARHWISRAGIARRPGIFPHAIRRVIHCGQFTVRLVSDFQGRVLADSVHRLVGQHTRPAGAGG